MNVIIDSQSQALQVAMSQSATVIRNANSSHGLRNAYTAEANQSKSYGNSQAGLGNSDSKLPVVKINKPGIDTGILTQRQKLWAAAKPNQGDVENPVLLKFEKRLRTKKQEKSESYLASQEVRGLQTDIQGKETEPTGIIERIQARRQERHDGVLEEMFQELTLINAELEPQIAEACATVKEYLDQDLQDIIQEMRILENDEDLMNFSLDEFHKLWKKTEHHTLVRQSWIDQLDLTLESIETDRAKLIEDIFKSFTQRLVRIAHLMPPDVHKLMENLCLETNKTLLSNKQSCADLIRRLKMSDIERERKYYLSWNTRVMDWKNMKKDFALKSFSSFMTSPAINDPPNLKREMESLTSQQKKFNNRRLELFKQLRDMKPPSSTKTAVYHWHNSLTTITEHLDALHEKYKSILQVNYEKVIQDCEEELTRVKAQLFNEGVLKGEEIDQLATEQMLPLIGEKRARFEYELEKFEKYTDEISAAQKQQFRSLFKYLQLAAHVWDTHEVALAKEERELQERLDKNRREHDTQNQIKEAKFDIVMDRMRQDASEEALKMSLKQSLEMLEEIKRSYHDFHAIQQTTVKQYPLLVKEETKDYEEAVCKYFGVEKQKRKQTAKSSEYDITNDDTAEKHSSTDMHKPENEPAIIMLSTGAMYYIYSEEEDYGPPPDTTATARTNYTFLTEDQEEVEVMPYVTSFEITTELIDETKNHVRKEFLEHLELWRKESVTRAENVMIAKADEFNNELELRLHLHEPRAERAEKDVHNVRAAELVKHRDRVTQHCQGILSSLASFKSRFSDMMIEHNSETDKFKSSVESLENTFVNATKSHELLSIKDEVSSRLDEYMGIIRASLRKFRQDLDEMLNNLRNSNARFRRMLKIFSEGGNFCPEEVEEFRKKLEHMASKIDNAEGSMMAELEGMETKRLDSAHDFSGKLEERFKHHLFDLTFLEKLSRWLTNIQVKIKSEVANSNTQDQKIAKMIATFDRRLDAIVRPNLDREQINASELHETLMPVLETFHERVIYLDCAVEKNIPSSVADLQNSNSRIETRQEESKTTSKRSKKLRNKESENAFTKGSRSKPTSKTALRNSDNETRPITVPNTKAASNTTVNPRVSLDADVEKTNRIKSASANGKNSFAKTAANSKYDKKYLVFGDGTERPLNHFLSYIKVICRDGLDGLLCTADLYYRQKGGRQSTRPNAIHDNFDICAESLINRLKSYESQAAEYHNSCIQEFRAQLQTFGKSVVRFPSLIINHKYDLYMNEMRCKEKELKTDFETKLQSLERQKRNHQTLLRPTLGHPNNRDELKNLKENEQLRQDNFADLVRDFADQNQEIQQNNADMFVEFLNQITEKLLWQFDSYLTIDDVKTGKIPPKPKTEKQLLREKMAGGTKQTDDEVKEEATISWQSLSVGSIFAQPVQIETDELKNIHTKKVTDAHKSVIEARDGAFQRYKNALRSSLNDLEADSKKLMQDELRWRENWDKSIKKIVDLY